MTRLLLLIISFCVITSSTAQINLYIQSNLPLIIGHDAKGQNYILCHAQLGDQIRLGKTWANYKYCVITSAGKEYKSTHFTIPPQSEFGPYVWSTNTNKAIKVGVSKEGHTLYLCQVSLNGNVEPGITWSGYNHCIISYNGHEVIAEKSSILSSM